MAKTITERTKFELKPKKCRVCKAAFTPTRSLQVCCSPACAIKKAQTDRGKKEKKELREAKIKAKTRGQWLKEAQAAYNRWIRYRDDNLPCVSCGRHHEGQFHAGHYMPTSTRPALRFNELNVHKQCSVCNNHKHGNLVLYRIELIKRIGLESVEWLESNHTAKHYSIQELIDIKDHYNKQAKNLKAD